MRIFLSFFGAICFLSIPLAYGQDPIDLEVTDVRFVDEQIYFDFSTPVQATSYIYTGPIGHAASGHGQSQGTRLNDAFYIYNEVDASGALLPSFVREPYLLTPEFAERKRREAEDRRKQNLRQIEDMRPE